MRFKKPDKEGCFQLVIGVGCMGAIVCMAVVLAGLVWLTYVLLTY